MIYLQYLVSSKSKISIKQFAIFLFLLFSSLHSHGQVKFEEDFKELFVEVQMKSIFPDSKTFPDCTPLYTPTEILNKYNSTKANPGFDLKKFVLNNFELPANGASEFKSNPNNPIVQHIEALWPVLTRKPDSARGSLIPLPYPYIVPGGRFREVYYWDSYFTLLGLKLSGQKQMVRNMVDNFAYLIDKIGFIPNGNRTYYLSRSQPPFFSLMVKVLAEIEGDSVLQHYLPQLEKEYAFWMDGETTLNDTKIANRRVIRLSGGEILNRYWDDKATPRSESYREDVLVAQKSKRAPEEIYRDIRAACESGWDFSSRWFKDENTLETIHTTKIIPVDLNSLLYHSEETIASAYQLNGKISESLKYKERTERRKKAILKYCWDPQKKFFYDYDFERGKTKNIRSLAALYPLFFNISTKDQALAVASEVRKSFLKPGGVSTTLAKTGQQWDAPNGWPPLQWITIKGLRNSEFTELADKISVRWIENNLRVYKNTGRMVEKYNVLDISLPAGGGEYSLQDGFGWSNGVLLQLMNDQNKY